MTDNSENSTRPRFDSIFQEEANSKILIYIKLHKILKPLIKKNFEAEL